METIKPESVCSNSSSESTANNNNNNDFIRDYSVSALKMDQVENHKIKLNFGVDRLLSKCSEIKDLDDQMAVINRNCAHLVDKNILMLSANSYNPANLNAINLQNMNSNLNNHNHNREENGVFESSQFGLNLLQQFPIASGLYGNQNHSFVLKPFPIRINQRNNQNGKIN